MKYQNRNTILITVLSVFFISSGILKYFPIEHFEITLNYYGMGLISSSIIARLVIITEIIGGLFLLVPSVRKKATVLLITLCSIFSIALLWFIITYPDAQDCGCSGKYLQTPPKWAIIRNIILIVFLTLSFKLPIVYKFNYFNKFKNYIWILGLFMLTMSFTYYPPDFMLKKSEVWLKSHEEKDLSKIDSLYMPDGSVTKFEPEDKYILAFFSTKCHFCKLSSSRLDALKKTNKNPYKTIYIFWGEHSQIDTFWRMTKTEKVPYSILNPQTFLNISGEELPAIFLMNNNKVIGKMGYRELDSEIIKEFGDK